ncbi:helix-turn-helix transcriptional regulator [Acrocarpospora catenulata]|uniref:helix-turn-helix transcriptional regulator n=1 Tax=Acrocarpospora catenulata TaxID=2836182 RepID=UPI001BDB41F4|nr:LuxR family transcriptional regulator [Acrocarpospora catenulata]
MELAERDEAVAQLRGLLDDAVHGEGRIALVGGAIGVGKSALLDDLVDLAFERGALALHAVCSSAETELPLAVLGQLLHNAPLVVADRERMLSLLDEGVRETGDRVDSHVAHALCAMLLELAERCPLLIVVDDVQFADQASLLCLSYLARRVRFRHVLAAFSHADVAWHPPALFQADLLRQPHCRHLRLGPLSPAGVARLAEQVASPAEAARLHHATGGSPLLVTALLADPPGGGENYGRAVLSCLGRAEPWLPRVARALAVLGQAGDVRPGEVSKLTGLGTDAVEYGLRSLAEMGVLDEAGRFRHRAAPAAILTDMDQDDRAALHRSAAELAFRGGAAAEAVAGHLVAASDGGGPWAVPALEEAARTALDEGRVADAVTYLTFADGACADEQRRAEIKTLLVRAEWRINPGAPTLYLAELADALRSGCLADADAVVLAKALMWHGRFDDAADVLTHVGPATGMDARAVAEVRATRAWLRCTYPLMTGHLPDAPADGRVITSARSIQRLQAAAGLATVLTGEPGAEVVPDLERVLRGARLDDMSMDAVECALLAMTFGGRLDLAAPWCDAYIEEAVARRAPSRQARLAAIRAEISLRQGDLMAADRYGELALHLVPATSWGVALGGPLSVRLRALTAMGRHEEAAELAVQPVPDPMANTRYGLQYLDARGHCHLAAGDPRAALRDFSTVGELTASWALDRPGLVSWRLGAAEALTRTGRSARARQLIQDQIGLAGPLLTREYGAALRLLAAAGEPRIRPQLLRQAADLLQEAGARYELACALTDLCSAYTRAGEARRARTVRKQALTLAEECAAEPLVRALSSDAEPGGRPESSTLSSAERRVADLAAIGYSNREIADKLFITVSTVEQHLTRIYRKLNISRRDLPVELTTAR